MRYVWLNLTSCKPGLCCTTRNATKNGSFQGSVLNMQQLINHTIGRNDIYLSLNSQNLINIKLPCHCNRRGLS